MPQLPLALSLLVFAACAGVIWVAGISLSNYTDVVSDRLHLGAALGGLVLLAVATNQPELAITVTAAANGRLDVAVSNILGGIAIQTVVLAALDAFGVPVGRPLTYQAASLALVLEGSVVVAILLATVMGAQLPKHAVAFRLTPDVIGIELSTGAAMIVNGGHPRPLRLRDGRVEELPLRAEPPFGLLAKRDYEAQELPLERGDRLMFFTDGMIERDAADFDLASLVTEGADLHPREAVQHVVQGFLGAVGSELSDDATAMGVD